MGEQQQGRSEVRPRHEYTEVVQTICHYSNLRFAINTIFFAVTGGAGFVAFGKGQFDAHAAIIARFGGFAVIALFWWYVDRVDQLLGHFRSEAVELERSLGYEAFTSRPTRSRYLPNLRNVGRIFFLRCSGCTQCSPCHSDEVKSGRLYAGYQRGGGHEDPDRGGHSRDRSASS